MKDSPSEELASFVLRLVRALGHALLGYAGGLLCLVSVVAASSAWIQRDDVSRWLPDALSAALLFGVGGRLLVRAWRLPRCDS